MNVRRVALFLLVVEHGTITAAADAAFMAQPALSRQMKTLQRELGIQLFEPSGQRLVLTSSGRGFVPIARELIRHQKDANEAVALLKWGRVRRLTGAATLASIRSFISHYIADVGTHGPMIIARVGGHYELESELLRGADFIVTPVLSRADLEKVHLGCGPLKVHVGPYHAWWGRSSIEMAELTRKALIVYAQPAVSRQLLDHALALHQVVPAEIIECEEGGNIQALAAAGFGIGISSEPSTYGTWSCDINELSSAQATRLNLWMAWKPAHYASSQMKIIADGLRDSIGTFGSSMIATGGGATGDGANELR